MRERALVQRPHPPQVIAHRGASKAERENTIAAFEAAGRMGAHAVELDARRTADGLVVVHHDAALADGRVIVELAAAELPAEVPTLAAALDACAGMWVNVELKNIPGEPDFDPSQELARTVMRELVDRGQNGRWLVSSFNMKAIDTCRMIDPGIRTALLCESPPRDAAALMVRRGHAAVHPWFPTVTPRLVEECHAAGVEVNVWTVDTPHDLEEMIRMGVDGLCTDVPDVALAVIAGL